MKTSLGGGCCDGDGGGCGGGGGLLPVEGRPVRLPGGIPSTAVAATYCRVPPALNHRLYCLCVCIYIPVRGPIYDRLRFVQVGAISVTTAGVLAASCITTNEITAQAYCIIGIIILL